MRGNWTQALRSLTRNKSFTVAALVCLMLGIGATTAIFSVVNAVVLRPLPYRQPEQLVRIYTEFPTAPNGGFRRFWTSGPEFLELKRDLKSWEVIEAWSTGGVNLSGTSQPVRANAAMVSGGLLKALGVAPVSGRLLGPSDDEYGAPLAVMISDGLWKSAFGGDPNLLQREIWVDGRKATVAGIMPAGFQFPPGEAEPADVWVPIQLNPASPGGRGGHRWSLLGRLKPGLGVNQARQEIESYVKATGEKAGPKTHVFNPRNHTLVVYPLQDEVTGSVRPALLAMLGAVVFVLLIACGNVANLLLARAEARQREVAVRRAMGATAWSLAKQFAVEGLVLAGLGAILGVIFAKVSLAVLLRAATGTLPRVQEIGIDGVVLGFTVGISLLTGLMFGLAPLVASLPRELSESLKASGGRTTATREAHWLRNGLVFAEVSLALILLVGAGLMVQAFWRLQNVNTGIRPENVMTLRVVLPREVYREGPQVLAFWRQLDEKIGQLPGVRAAGLVSGLPPDRPINANDTEIEGFVPTPDGPIQNVDYYNAVTPGSLDALGVRLVEGRWVNASDGETSPSVVVVNEAMARVFYPGKSAIGRRIRPSGDENWRTIVGVVADVRNGGLSRPAGTELFIPYTQTRGEFRGGNLVLRAQGEPETVLPATRDAVRSLDPSLPLANVRPMTEVMDRARSRPLLLASLLGLFSAVALGLAALGLYGVLSYSVAQRTNEIGVRMAMGADRSDVIHLVLRQGMSFVVAGLLAGAAGSYFLVRWLKGTVFGIEQFSPIPVLAVGLVLALVGLLACLSPAMRATRVDPVTALRYE